MNATTSGPRITGEHIAAVMEALQSVADAESPGPLTKAGLSSLIGIPSRTVEATIEAIRRNSIALVCSGQDGYWLPADLEEAAANIERRYQRALTQMGTVGGERTLIQRLRDAEALATWESTFPVAVAS